LEFSEANGTGIGEINTSTFPPVLPIPPNTGIGLRFPIPNEMVSGSANERWSNGALGRWSVGAPVPQCPSAPMPQFLNIK